MPDIDADNEFNIIMNEMNDAYAKGRLNELHFNLLKERISDYKTNLKSTKGE